MLHSTNTEDPMAMFEETNFDSSLFHSTGYLNKQKTESAQEVLLSLASQIDATQRCRFNINRSSVLDGGLRGFKRLSYNPKYQMNIKFSDDLGLSEEAVDLGGPRREFLRLLMEALAVSPMFEGRAGRLNLALDSTGT